MNRLVVALLVIIAIAWVGFSGFRVQGTAWLAFDMAVLAIPLIYFRRHPRFADFLESTMLVALCSASIIVLTYLAARSHRPLADHWLAACDNWLGFPTIYFKSVHSGILEFAYKLMPAECVAVLLILSLTGRREQLRKFITQTFLAALITVVAFIFFPAEGPFTSAFSPTAGQSLYLEHLHALRAGTMSSVSLSQVQGLVTFPSFHTMWAFIMATALADTRWKIPGMVLSILIIIATLTTGWHYTTDVLAALAASILIIYITEDKVLNSLLSRLRKRVDFLRKKLFATDGSLVTMSK